MDDLLAAVAGRWRERDPLLPAPRRPTAEQRLLSVPSRGAATAVGAITRAKSDPATASLTWSAAERFTLTPLFAGPDPTRSLDALLTRWHKAIAADARSAGPDSAAYVWVPSRDTEAVPALFAHGLAPVVVVAARPVTAASTQSHPAVPVRRATLADLDAVSALWLALVRYESQFGTGYERPTTRRHLNDDAQRLLTGPDPWVWLAEPNGQPAGLMMVWPPADNDWLEPFTHARPLAYIGTTWVDAKARGAGLGAALVTAAHQAAGSAGTAATLLHYGMLNPLSGPFWHRAGYRPLWTGWQARPAATLR